MVESVSEGTGGGDRLIVFVFLCVFRFFCLRLLVHLFKWLEQDGCCVSFFVCSFFSLYLVPFRWLVGLKVIQPEQQIMELLIILAKKLKPILFQGYKSA